MSSPPERVVAAAGGLVWRRSSDAALGDDALEVAVVHRPRYDDWSLPKGKLDAGEHALTAAVREVGEETGLRVVVGRRSLRTRYPVADGDKRVDYWVMQAVGGTFEPNREVDDLRWLPLDGAAALITHEHDRLVVADLARTDVPLMPTLILVRHGRAGDRAQWDDDDDLRPLDEKGRRQAQRLGEVLPAFSPLELLTALPLRCRQTLEPLADRRGLPITPLVELGEEEFDADPDAGMSAVERLLAADGGPGVTVVCSQGGAIPSVLEHLGVRQETDGTSPPAAKGSCWVLGGRPGALTADYYRDLEPDPDAPTPR